MPKPGVGYTVSNPTSFYVVGTLASPVQSHRMDLSALPADGHTWSFPADTAAYEKRYGPGTAHFGDTGFKKWAYSPQNELKFVVEDALRWWGAQHPNPEFDGQPTAVEITDVQASNDMVWHTYLLTTPGFSPNNPQHINDPGKPAGAFQEMNPFWGMNNYYVNDAKPATPPPPPQTPPPPETPPPAQVPPPQTPPPTPPQAPPPPTRYQPHHAWLSKVPYARMRQAFGKRWAWPLDVIVQKHNLQDEVVDAWIASLDGQGKESPLFVELEKEFGP